MHAFRPTYGTFEGEMALYASSADYYFRRPTRKNPNFRYLIFLKFAIFTVIQMIH